jgi:hypothetical protein
MTKIIVVFLKSAKVPRNQSVNVAQVSVAVLPDVRKTTPKYTVGTER